jgi:hypothetical protein
MLGGSFRPSSRPLWPASQMAGKLVRLGRFELPLDAPSTHCLCRWATDAPPEQPGSRPASRTAKVLVNQVGLEPTKAFANGLRGRSLCRSGHWSLARPSSRPTWGRRRERRKNGERRRLRSACPQLKRLLPLHSGSRLGVHDLVQAGGVEPPATRLSAEALAVRTRLRKWCVLHESNVGPPPCRDGALTN